MLKQNSRVIPLEILLFKRFRRPRHKSDMYKHKTLLVEQRFLLRISIWSPAISRCETVKKISLSNQPTEWMPRQHLVGVIQCDSWDALPAPQACPPPRSHRPHRRIRIPGWTPSRSSGSNHSFITKGARMQKKDQIPYCGNKILAWEITLGNQTLAYVCLAESSRHHPKKYRTKSCYSWKSNSKTKCTHSDPQ